MRDASPPAQTCLVVGGGIIGAACALRLQQARLAVTLVDPGDPERAAAFGNIGHIALEQGAPLASLQTLASIPSRLFGVGGPVDFRFRDVGLWLPWSLRLCRAALPDRYRAGRSALGMLLASAGEDWLRLVEDAGLAPASIALNGHGVVWFDPRRALAGRKAWESAPLGRAQIAPMSEAELDAYGAVLARRPAAGLSFSGTGKVRDPGGLLQDLRAAAARSGVISRNSVVTGIDADAARARVHLASGEVMEADLLLMAAGAGSGVLMRTLGLTVPLIGERGYSVRWAEHAWPESLKLTVFEEMSVVAARFDSGLRLAGMTEFGAPQALPDARKWTRLEAQARQLGLPSRGDAKRWSGARPTLPDYLPAMGRLVARPRVLYAFGHQHLGLTVAAATARHMADLAMGREPAIDMHAFRLERFR